MVSGTYTESEERIFQAALKVFARKGKDGARMQEIADEAGINKAMLHYYFRSKADLYARVFDYVFIRFMESFEEAMAEVDTFADTLRVFIDEYVDFVDDNLDVMRLMVNEQLSGGHVLRRRLKPLLEGGTAPPRHFIQRLIQASLRGEVRPVDPFQTMLTVVSGCVFFFIAFPMVSAIIPAAADREQFIEHRKRHLFDLLYHGLKPRAGEAEENDRG